MELRLSPMPNNLQQCDNENSDTYLLVGYFRLE